MSYIKTICLYLIASNSTCKMVKKKSTPLLLTSVIIIWGYIVFRFVNQLSFSQPKEVVAFNFDTDFKLQPIKKDSIYSLKLNYKDPFLGEKNIKVKKFNPLRKSEVFPKIMYNGYMGAANHPTVFLVKVNSEQKMFRLYQNIEGLKLIKASSSKLIFEYKGVLKEYLLLRG